MVTQAYISGLVAGGRFFPPVDRTAITNGLLEALQDGLPDWDDPPTDALLYRALPYISAYVQTQVEMGQSQLLRGLLATAQGSDLDVIGLGPPVVLRRAGESDDDYRLRIAQGVTQLSRGTLAGIENLASTFNTAIADVRAYVSPNRQDVRVFPVGQMVTQLATADRMALQVYLGGRTIALAGVDTTVQEPTIKQYRIKANGVYDPALYSASQVIALMRTALNAFVAENEMVGWTVYESALRDAAYVPELRDVSVTFVRPTNGDAFAQDDAGVDTAGNLAARAGFTAADIYTCQRNEANIILTATEVA